MNTEAIRDSVLEAQARPSADLSPARSFYWAVRRELWENRLIYLAPIGVGALALAGLAFGTIHLPQQMRAAMALGPMKQHHMTGAYDIVSGLMMATMMIVATFYCLDALYGERRDRSVLFWKSLPVSNTTTVLAKASIPFVVLPLIAFAIGVVMQLVILLLSSAVLAGSGLSVAPLWAQVALPRMLVLLLYHLVMVHALWHAPFYAWFLLVGAWARRSPFVWAFLPPVLLGFLEKIIFNTTHFLDLVRYRLNGNSMDVVLMHGTFPTNPMTQMTPIRYLSSPGLWTGLIFTAALLAAAVWLRRTRGSN
ncbi:MAG: ABC transporter permease [Terriglobales bacterium]